MSWDAELLDVLPPAVAAQFPFVLNSGCIMLKQQSDDMCREVAAGRRSFNEYRRNWMEHQHQLYYSRLQQYLDYQLRCKKKPQLLWCSSGDSSCAAAQPLNTAPALAPAQPAAAAAQPISLSPAAGGPVLREPLTQKQQLPQPQQQGKQQQPTKGKNSRTADL